MLPRSKHAPTARMPDKSVLLVEDNPVLAEAIEFALTTFGWTVVGPCASNGAAAEALASTTFSTAILDLDLGEELSIPTAEALRASGIPFVFMTGHDAQAMLPEAFRSERCLVKPVDPEALVDALEALGPAA